MDNKKLELFLSAVQSDFGHVVSLEFKWDNIGVERIFNLYVVLESDHEKRCHIVFFDVCRLNIKQPTASGILFNIGAKIEGNQGPFLQKKYCYIYDDWIDFYCTDVEYYIE